MDTHKIRLSPAANLLLGVCLDVPFVAETHEVRVGRAVPKAPHARGHVGRGISTQKTVQVTLARSFCDAKVTVAAVCNRSVGVAWPADVVCELGQVEGPIDLRGASQQVDIAATFCSAFDRRTSCGTVHGQACTIDALVFMYNDKEFRNFTVVVEITSLCRSPLLTSE